MLRETLELEAQEAAQNAAAAPLPKKASPSPPAEPQKWSKEKHPAFQPGFRSAQASESPAPASPAPVVFKVNDTVSAKWKSGDKGFHAGRITSITGSSSAPIYHVKFNDNGATEQVRSGELRHIGQKRKADGSPAVHVPTPPSSAGVITKQPDVNPQLADQARKPEPMMVRDGPPKPQKFQKKAPSNKVLETQRSTWQNFQSKKVGTKKKESMFKTGEGHNARGESRHNFLRGRLLTSSQWASSVPVTKCAKTRSVHATTTLKMILMDIENVPATRFTST